jgi:hypothetical protein
MTIVRPCAASWRSVEASSVPCRIKGCSQLVHQQKRLDGNRTGDRDTLRFSADNSCNSTAEAVANAEADQRLLGTRFCVREGRYVTWTSASRILVHDVSK